MIDPTAAWLNALALMAGYGAAELQHRIRKPRQPAPGTRRVYYDMPSTIAECGGPCSFGGPELCDCGALWRDVPIKPQSPSPRVIPGDTP